ncbi:hypothetical protein RchiOBHm_Chr6g0256021 [Rosa chinensis]|uniref:Uncharacterized protein n=1 Tax=Rosa chinensis TaxID=74649 RepID=A0A2P6PM07_ROSCH|nr:hypothetical protein RchiOBHm_Chr6g0256021 [Rosa chinensis]
MQLVDLEIMKIQMVSEEISHRSRSRAPRHSSAISSTLDKLKNVGIVLLH